MWGPLHDIANHCLVSQNQPFFISLCQIHIVYSGVNTSIEAELSTDVLDASSPHVKGLEQYLKISKSSIKSS